MSDNILLTVSQDDIMSPYKFKNTNIRVYSFEEAIYHVYHYFKQSSEDFTSEQFISWVNDILGLTVIASQLKNISTVQSFSKRLTRFLTLIDYFSDVQLEKIKEELTIWENRLEWEQLKESADYMINNNNIEKGIGLYLQAIKYGDNIYLFNNLGIAYMKKGDFREAYNILSKAYHMERNIDVTINFCEAAIYNKKYEEALSIIQQLEQINIIDTVYYLKGMLEVETKNYNNAILYFTQGFEKTNEDYYLYKISEVYVKKRDYLKAIDILSSVTCKDSDYLCKIAEIHVSDLNVPEAVKCMQKAITKDRENISIWINLAKYHRLDYDLVKASSSISKALMIDANNELAQIENARIKKSQGKIKEYQNTLHVILNMFKKKYREMNN